MSAILWHEILLQWPQNNSCVSVWSHHHPGRLSPCMSAAHRCTRQAAKGQRERDCCVFIKSTREQLRGLCSLDTPPLFIHRPPAVTRTFYFSLLIHSRIIFTKKKKERKKKDTHDPLALEGRGGSVPRGECAVMLYSLSAYVSNRQEVPKTLSELFTLCVYLTLSSKQRPFFFFSLLSGLLW